MAPWLMFAITIGTIIFTTGLTWGALKARLEILSSDTGRIAIDLENRRLQFDKAQERWVMSLEREEKDRRASHHELREAISKVQEKLIRLEIGGTAEAKAAVAGVESLRAAMAIVSAEVRALQVNVAQMDKYIGALMERKG